MKKTSALDMTTGRITGLILRFALPLLIGNIFQQFYNAADSIIVGRFVGKQALAALGVTSPVMNIVIFTVIGLCTGASIFMATLWEKGTWKSAGGSFPPASLQGSALPSSSP